jgi:MFS family permease
MNVLSRDLTIQTEVELFKQMGNTAQTAALMATAQSFSGLGEFLLNPLFAQLSDRFGRKPFVNMLCLYSLLGNSILASNPFMKLGSVPFVVINRALTGLLSSQSGSVMGTNALSDLSSGPSLGINLASMSGHFGFGMVVGPFLGNQALIRGGQVAVYRTRVLMSVLHLLHNLSMIPETLPKSKPFSLQGLNPLGFLKLLWIGDVSLLCKLTRSLLVCTCEQKNLINTKALWLKENLQLSFTESQNVMMAYSASIWASGQFLAGRIIKLLGATMFSDATMALNAIAFSTWANAKSRFGLWLGLLLHIPGVNGTGASMVKADMITRAGQLGIGKGEMNGYYMNLRAALVMFVPQLLARIYIARLPSGKSGQAWYLMALFAALSGVLRA